MLRASIDAGLLIVLAHWIGRNPSPQVAGLPVESVIL
jgi:hypothetical protein